MQEQLAQKMSRLLSYTRFFNVNDIRLANPEERVIDAAVVWIQARVELPVMVPWILVILI